VVAGDPAAVVVASAAVVAAVVAAVAAAGVAAAGVGEAAVAALVGVVRATAHLDHQRPVAVVLVVGGLEVGGLVVAHQDAAVSARVGRPQVVDRCPRVRRFDPKGRSSYQAS
jgi:hypothetical protein